jgi:hypothetical protein
MNMDMTAVALRVLNAIARDLPPAPVDVDALKLSVEPEGRLLAAEDLARLVLNCELDRNLKRF